MRYDQMSAFARMIGLPFEEGLLLPVPTDDGVATLTEGDVADACAASAASSERAMYARTRTPPGLYSLARADKNDIISP